MKHFTHYIFSFRKISQTIISEGQKEKKKHLHPHIQAAHFELFGDFNKKCYYTERRKWVKFMSLLMKGNGTRIHSLLSRIKQDKSRRAVNRTIWANAIFRTRKAVQVKNTINTQERLRQVLRNEKTNMGHIRQKNRGSNKRLGRDKITLGQCFAKVLLWNWWANEMHECTVGTVRPCSGEQMDHRMWSSAWSVHVNVWLWAWLWAWAWSC